MKFLKYDNSTDQVFSIGNRLLTLQGILNLDKKLCKFRTAVSEILSFVGNMEHTDTCHLYTISMPGVPVQLAV